MTRKPTAGCWRKTDGDLDSGHGYLLADPVGNHCMVKVGSLMWWLHEVEIHLAIGAFSAGTAFGIALAAAIIWRNK